jgi:hypothetical protein
MVSLTQKMFFRLNPIGHSVEYASSGWKAGKTEPRNDPGELKD